MEPFNPEGIAFPRAQKHPPKVGQNKPTPRLLGTFDPFTTTDKTTHGGRIRTPCGHGAHAHACSYSLTYLDGAGLVSAGVLNDVGHKAPLVALLQQVDLNQGPQSLALIGR